MLLGIKDKSNNILPDVSWEFATTVLPLKPIDYVGAAPTVVAGDAQVTVKWADVVGAISYNLYVDINNSGTFTKLNVDAITGTTFTHTSSSTGLTDPSLVANNNSEFTYRVTVVNANQEEGLPSAASELANPIALPSIAYFKAVSENINEGDSTVLEAEFFNGIGTITASDSSAVPALKLKPGFADIYVVTVSPTVNTTYTLNVVNTNGDKATIIPVTVNVNNSGQFSFEFLNSTVSETDGVITLKVLRTGGSVGSVTVEYQTITQTGNSFASANIDYKAVISSPKTPLPKINFPDKNTEQFITIEILDDNVMNEVLESFSVGLVNPSNGASIDTAGGKNVHTVTIVDEDMLSVKFGLKQLKFSWANDPRAVKYQLYEKKNIDGLGFNPILDSTVNLFNKLDITIYDYDWVGTSYLLEACDINNVCMRTNVVDTTNQALKTIGYFKASNPDKEDWFGVSIALSSDGRTMAVGASQEQSAESGIINYSTINSNPFPEPVADNDTLNWSGAVYVFVLEFGNWHQQSYIKASNPGFDDVFGYSVSLSSDGNTLAVGAYKESSNQSGIVNAGDGTAFPITEVGVAETISGGAVYVFTRKNKNWSQTAYIKGDGSNYSNEVGAGFGFNVRLSGDGLTLATGAPFEDFLYTTNTITSPNVVWRDVGMAYVYIRDNVNSNWRKQTSFRNYSWQAEFDQFGISVALSYDGKTLAVGSWGEGDKNTGVINGELNFLSRTTADNTGSVVIYDLSARASSPVQNAFFQGSNSTADDRFGSLIDMSDDGNTLIAGAWGEASDTIGINNIDGQPTSDPLVADNSGAVYIFTRNASTSNLWVQDAYIKADNTQTNDFFGDSVAISGDGLMIAVGADYEDSNQVGVINSSGFPNKATDNNSAKSIAGSGDAGAVYIYRKINDSWVQQSYIKSSNTGAWDWFGRTIALSGTLLPDGTYFNDGSTLAISAPGEAGITPGVDNENISPDLTDSAKSSGAIYLY